MSLVQIFFRRSSGMLLGVSLFAVCLLAVCPILGGTAAGVRAADDLLAARDAQEKTYAEDLKKLAAWCEEQKLPEQAEKTREWLKPRDPRVLVFPLLPLQVGRPKLPGDSGPKVREWHDKFWTLREARGEKLFNLARAAVKANRASLAYELIFEAIREHPHHEAVRKLMGYRSFKNEWHTPFEIELLKKNYVRHAKFGWMPKNFAERYDKGERYLPDVKKWIKADEDAKLHADIASGWEIETEHYVVQTNHGMEAGVQLAEKLESLYRVWQQLFVRYYMPQNSVDMLFQGRAAAFKPRHKHRVVYFRTKEEYNQAMEKYIPKGVETLGIYISDRSIAFFFATENEDYTTLYHEATHQLFQETRVTPPLIGQENNFWIVEGIACYMESMEIHEDHITLGGRKTQRYLDAEFRFLNDNFYIPLAEFTSYSIQDLQRDERIRTIYSQASGLTHFLMHHEEGKYRDPLIAYLVSIYSGRDRLSSLTEVTGAPFEELDTQYRAFISDKGISVKGKEAQATE